jgi:oligo-alginate lyase
MNRRELMQAIVASTIAAASAPPIRAFGTVAESVAGHMHPKLYLTPLTLGHLRHRFNTDANWSAQLMRDGETLLAEEFIPESVAEEGGGQQANYGKPAQQIAFMGVALGLLYQLTKQEKYAAKLHAAMQHYGNYVRWGGPGLADRDPPWHSELDTAQFCFGFANGYDTLSSFLSPEERRQIRETVVRLGILPTLDDWISPGKRFHSLDSMGHNWWGVCVAGAGVAALALSDEDDRAPQWIRSLDEGFVEWFTYGGNALHNRIETFEPNGGPSYEGVNYTRYAIASYLRYLLAWKNAFPQRKPATVEYLRGIPGFFLHTLYPATHDSFAVNFDDCRIDANAGDAVLLLIACGLDDTYGHTYLRYAHGRIEDPLALYLQAPQVSPDTSLPLSKVYPRMGWAMMRDTWQPDATMLAVKSGYTWNHAHADASTFLLMHKGRPLIIDSGTCNYARPEYSTYYRQSMAHNLLLFDGAGQATDQIDRGAKFRGSILNWFDGVGMRYIGVDATGPMADVATRHYRHFLWLGAVLLIIDDIATRRDVRLDWLLHTAGNTRQDGPQSLLLQNDAAAARFTLLYPPGAKIEERDGLAPQHPDQHIPYHAFIFNTHDRRQRVVSVLDLNPAEPSITEIREHPEYLDIAVQTAAETHHAYLNLRSIDGAYNMSSTISIDDWSTDAYLLSITHHREATALPVSVSRFFVLDASFLRHHQSSVMESLSKVSCLWNQSSQTAVFTQGQNKLHVAVSCSQRPVNLRWNGVDASGEYDAASHLLHLRSFSVS